MKKIKLLGISMLTLLIGLFCFVGCAPMEGEYKLSAWKLNVGATETEIKIDETSESYLSVNLEEDGVVTVSGKLVYNGLTVLDITTPQTGTWEKGEERNTVEISVGNVFNVTATMKKNTMTVKLMAGTLILKK